MRIGHGYDAHRFCENRPLILGGVKVDHRFGLLGHSDADVVTHAIIDSILGAACLGDIGTLFPDNDDEYKNIYSIKLLEKAITIIVEKEYIISNIDVTIICQEPRLSNYISEMKKILCDVMSIDSDQVNIKATTEENMGFTGRLEGIRCHCVSLIYKKGDLNAIY
ncbi:MAG: 2-C-methyl-D-erythritol 2,4-cyclodiphosphate synthase [Oscillospiraceae bacterium]